MRAARLLLAGLVLASAALRADARPVVILLSMDGVRHDAIADPALAAFARIAREGVRAEALAPVFPSTTFPNHVSLATGTYPDRHGIVGNAFVDPTLGRFHYGNDARFLEAEPLWAAAERQGVPAAVFFWVGSETDWRGTGARDRRAPFDAGVPESEKVTQILAWLDRPEAERPGLVMSWWHGADHAAHRHGPGSDEAREALRDQDGALGGLLAALDERGAWAETTLVVVSDHGMTTYERTLDVREALADVGIAARVIDAVGTAQIYLERTEDAERAVEVLRGHPGVEAWPRDGIPESFRTRSPRVGDVLALATPPLALLADGEPGARFGWLLRLLGRRLGAHGYDPARVPAMDGIFVAMGRGVGAGGRLPRVGVIDVAPTVAELLGIEPPSASEGHPLALDAALSPTSPPPPLPR